MKNKYPAPKMKWAAPKPAKKASKSDTFAKFGQKA
jgi:hypothetical protein